MPRTGTVQLPGPLPAMSAPCKSCPVLNTGFKGSKQHFDVPTSSVRSVPTSRTYSCCKQTTQRIWLSKQGFKGLQSCFSHCFLCQAGFDPTKNMPSGLDDAKCFRSLAFHAERAMLDIIPRIFQEKPRQKQARAQLRSYMTQTGSFCPRTLV